MTTNLRQSARVVLAIKMSTSEEISKEWSDEFFQELIRRPKYMTEVRRDGKDNEVIINLIGHEFERRLITHQRKKAKFIRRFHIFKRDYASNLIFAYRMREYAFACWQTCEQLHQLMLDDDQPENEKMRLDPDHWYEINLTNAALFANLTLDGLPQLVPGRLFSTRMPRDIVQDIGERRDFIDKCRKNDLRVNRALVHCILQVLRQL